MNKVQDIVTVNVTEVGFGDVPPPNMLREKLPTQVALQQQQQQQHLLPSELVVVDRRSPPTTGVITGPMGKPATPISCSELDENMTNPPFGSSCRSVFFTMYKWMCGCFCFKTRLRWREEVKKEEKEEKFFCQIKLSLHFTAPPQTMDDLFSRLVFLSSHVSKSIVKF